MKAPGFTKRGSIYSMIRPLRGKRLNLTKRYCCTVLGCTCFHENSALGGLARSLSRSFTHMVQWRLKIQKMGNPLKSMANALSHFSSTLTIKRVVWNW